MESIDIQIFLWINGWVGENYLLDEIARIIVSDYLIPVGFSMTMVGLWFSGKTTLVRQAYQKAVIVGVGSIGLSNLIVAGINHFYFRVRPFNDLDVSLLFYKPTDSSFPANPAAMVFTVAIAIWMVNKKIGYMLIAIAMLFSLARIYSGVFYPSDILAGALIGIFCALILTKVRKLIEPVPTLVLKFARIFCLA
mgnify:CR=1 FL=1